MSTRSGPDAIAYANRTALPDGFGHGWYRATAASRAGAWGAVADAATALAGVVQRPRDRLGSLERRAQLLRGEVPELEAGARRGAAQSEAAVGLGIGLVGGRGGEVRPHAEDLLDGHAVTRCLQRDVEPA